MVGVAPVAGEIDLCGIDDPLVRTLLYEGCSLVFGVDIGIACRLPLSWEFVAGCTKLSGKSKPIVKKERSEENGIDSIHICFNYLAKKQEVLSKNAKIL